MVSASLDQVLAEVSVNLAAVSASLAALAILNRNPRGLLTKDQNHTLWADLQLWSDKNVVGCCQEAIIVRSQHSEDCTPEKLYGRPFQFNDKRVFRNCGVKLGIL